MENPFHCCMKQARLTMLNWYQLDNILISQVLSEIKKQGQLLKNKLGTPFSPPPKTFVAALLLKCTALASNILYCNVIIIVSRNHGWETS